MIGDSSRFDTMRNCEVTHSYAVFGVPTWATANISPPDLTRRAAILRQELPAAQHRASLGKGLAAGPRRCHGEVMTNRPSKLRWNHNIHYHRLILAAVPQSARSALDVGTGNGLLAADLHKHIPEVTGLDVDADVLESARIEDPEVNWILGDVLTFPFEQASYDVVASVATLHHLPDIAQTLARLADLVAPGGVLAVVGLARSTRPTDVFYDLAGVVQHQFFKRRYSVWEHSAPIVWPPPHSYSDVQRAARRVLPNAEWTRLAMWRYGLVWHKPVS